MYNLLKQRQEQHYSPFTAAAAPTPTPIPNYDADCRKVGGTPSANPTTGWVRCQIGVCDCSKTSPPNCGDAPFNQYYYCPYGKKCIGKKPDIQTCVCDQCPMAYKVLPSTTSVYNDNNVPTDCGKGKQALEPVCSYKLDMKYCKNTPPNLRLPYKVREQEVTNGCRLETSWYPAEGCSNQCTQKLTKSCIDSKGKLASPSTICYPGRPRSTYEKIVECRGGLCPKK